MSEINILGVYITRIKKEEVIKKIEKFVKEKRPKYAVTVNPEMILEANEDEEFLHILNKADLSLADGMGLKVAGWFLGKNLVRIPGSDLTRDLLELARDKQWPVGVINYRQGLSSNREIEQALTDQFPGLQVLVSSVSRNEEEIKNFQEERMAQFQPRLILVGLGAPWQEKFLFHSLKNFPGAGFGVGVGGSLDFLTGKISRAPKVLRVLGLEWLWRLAKQPSRWRRIYKAVVVFPWKFLKWRFIRPLQYRPNVACLLYKKEQGRYKILVVERKEQKGQWQLPQGGTEGEDIVTAGSRELKEELNCDNFRPRASHKNLHKYKIPKSPGRMSKYRGYKGQKQSLFVAEFTGEDSAITINFWDHQDWKWVDKKDLMKVVQPIRKKATRKYLEKFDQFLKT